MDDVPDVWAERIARRQKVFEQIRHSDDILFVVLRILHRHNPVGISYKENPDEYMHEVEAVLPRLNDAQSKSDVRAILHDVFVQKFDANLAGPEEKYDGAAQEVWEAWRKWLAAS